MPLDPDGPLFGHPTLGPDPRVPLRVCYAGPSFRDGGVLRAADMEFSTIEDGEASLGGLRLHSLPPRALRFTTPREHAFTVPVTFQVLYPDSLFAVQTSTDGEPDLSHFYLSAESATFVSRRANGQVTMNPSETTYEQAMHYIIAAASNLVSLYTLTSEREDWRWAMLAENPSFAEKVTGSNWEDVWPLLKYEAFKLTVYLIEVRPEGIGPWETWHSNPQQELIAAAIDQATTEEQLERIFANEMQIDIL